MAKLGTWDTGRLQLTFLMPAAAPPNLTAVQVDWRRIAFTSTATLTYPTLRQPLEEQPLVEVFLASEGRRREPGAIVFTAVLMLAAAFVAWGRFGPYSF
jgi:hypothetical protein